MNRRKFLKLLGKVTAVSGIAAAVGLPEIDEDNLEDERLATLYPDAEQFEVEQGYVVQGSGGHYEFVSFDKDGFTIQWANSQFEQSTQELPCKAPKSVV